MSVKPRDGKASLIAFFSDFCPLCRELGPSVRQIASRSDGTIRVIGANLAGKRFAGAVRSLVTEYGFEFPVLIDGREAARGSYAADKMRDLVRDFDRIAAGLEPD